MVLKPSIFYSKRGDIATCIPANPVESDVSSESDSESAVVACVTHKKNAVIPAIDDFQENSGSVSDSSDSASEVSAERWPRSKNVHDDITIAPSEDSISSPNMSPPSGLDLSLLIAPSEVKILSSSQLSLRDIDCNNNVEETSVNARKRTRKVPLAKGIIVSERYPRYLRHSDCKKESSSCKENPHSINTGHPPKGLGVLSNSQTDKFLTPSHRKGEGKTTKSARVFGTLLSNVVNKEPTEERHVAWSPSLKMPCTSSPLLTARQVSIPTPDVSEISFINESAYVEPHSNEIQETSLSLTSMSKDESHKDTSHNHSSSSDGIPVIKQAKTSKGQSRPSTRRSLFHAFARLGPSAELSEPWDVNNCFKHTNTAGPDETTNEESCCGTVDTCKKASAQGSLDDVCKRLQNECDVISADDNICDMTSASDDVPLVQLVKKKNDSSHLPVRKAKILKTKIFGPSVELSEPWDVNKSFKHIKTAGREETTNKESCCGTVDTCKEASAQGSLDDVCKRLQNECDVISADDNICDMTSASDDVPLVQLVKKKNDSSHLPVCKARIPNEKGDDAPQAERTSSNYVQQNLKHSKASMKKSGKVSKAQRVEENSEDLYCLDLDLTPEWRDEDLSYVHSPRSHSTRQPLDLNEDLKDPEAYFSYYFDQDILQVILDQSNLYSTQKHGSSLNITMSEMKAFLAIFIYMGICKLPSIRDYWAESTAVKQVAEIMPRRRFEKIRSHLHFHDNCNTAPDEKDRMIKIRVLLNHIRHKCQALPQEEEYSIDECMVGYKGTFAGNLRQYLPDKPGHKWGFKIFSMAGKSGITHDFLPYSGQNTFFQENLTKREQDLGLGAMAVISLAKSIKDPAQSTLTFDNYYTGLPLMVYLKNEMKLLALGTIQKNRTKNCPLEDDKTLMKRGRGSYDFKKSREGVLVLKWADNKAVCLATTKVGVEPVGSILRWSKDAKAKVLVSCPQAILTYNATMGGVDLSDMYMSLYRCPSKSKRWYFPLFGYMVDLALTNSFLTYKRECTQQGQKLVYNTSKEFRLKVYAALVTPSQASRGRPRIDRSLSKKRIMNPSTPRPSDNLRYDNLEHYLCTTTKGRCRYCKTGYSRKKCSKCDVRLCFSKGKNCAAQFHLKQ